MFLMFSSTNLWCFKTPVTLLSPGTLPLAHGSETAAVMFNSSRAVGVALMASGHGSLTGTERGNGWTSHFPPRPDKVW